MENNKSGFKKGIVIPTTALILGVIAFGGATEASAAEYTPATWEARSPEEIVITDRSVYLIIWGDTLWAISEASGVSVDALVQINNIANRDLIYVGNILVIEGKVVTVTEQNGEKSSFVVDGDTVTPTNNHAVSDTPTPVAPIVTEEDDSGNFTVDITDKKEEKAVVETKPEVTEDNEKEDFDEDDGGNFRPVSPDEEVTDPVVELPEEKDVTPDEPVEEEDYEEPAFDEADSSEVPAELVLDGYIGLKEPLRRT